MAKQAVVFSGRNGLDFQELRSAVLRIPEVSLRVREAQTILDGLDLPKVDLFNIISGDDSIFFRNIKLKALASAIVQVGLFERLMKTYSSKPDLMIGESGGDSAMQVCAGLRTFRELIETSPALETLKPSEKILTLVAAQAPLLSGISLTEYTALRSSNDSEGKAIYLPAREGLMDLKRVVGSLIEEEGVTRFINIGPAGTLGSADYKSLGSDEIESLDSIELDPMLGWFWSNLRQNLSARAQ